MTKTISHIEEVLELTDYAEVAYRRPELEGGLGEIWDITLPDEQTTIRICEDDGTIYVYVFVNGRAQIEDGRMEFRHALAAPTYVALVLDQLVADYSCRGRRPRCPRTKNRAAAELDGPYATPAEMAARGGSNDGPYATPEEMAARRDAMAVTTTDM